MIVLNRFNVLVITAGVILFTRSGVLADQLCLAGDFDSQLQYILRKEMLSAQDIENLSQLLDDVQLTLNKRWQDNEVLPFGSVTTGLGSKTSDADLCIRLQNESSLDTLYVLEESYKLFVEQPSLYSNISFRYNEKLALLKFFHIPSQRWVDSVYKFGISGVWNSKLIRYYFNLDQRFLPLGGILKYWFEIHRLSGSRKSLPNYAVYMLIIFYLQQKHMALPVYLLQKDSVSLFTDKWDMGFNEIPYNSTNTETIHQLLGGFFEYYSQFNFEEYIVSPFAGRPIHKNAFVDIQNFPKEFSLYKYNLKDTLQLRIKNGLNTSTDLCIQDVLQHNINTGGRLPHEDSTRFKSLLKSVARLFEELPSDKFLRSFLIVDIQNNETVINQNNVTEEPEDCIEVTVT